MSAFVKICYRNLDVLGQSKEITRFESQHPLQVKSHPAGKEWEDREDGGRIKGDSM